MLKKSLFCCCLIFCARPAAAGWLIWESPEPVAAPKTETAAVISELADKLPRRADGDKTSLGRRINIVIAGRQFPLMSLLERLGWENCPSAFVKSAGRALIDLSNGLPTAKFPPARRQYLDKRVQDMTFVKRNIGGYPRSELAIWRLPYKTKSGLPVWCAALFMPENCGAKDCAPPQERFAGEIGKSAHATLKNLPSGVKPPDTMLLIVIPE